MKTYASKGFPKRVEGRITEKRYQELMEILERDPSLTLSELIRRILQNQPVRHQVKSGEFSAVMEQLFEIQTHLKKIGNNVNQLVKAFHGNTSSIQKFLLGKKLGEYQEQLNVEYGRIELVLEQLQIKWLSE
ncbi:plasmid mobilization relaxosome protein MobC [Algoriphagus litoralis]|uniref:plasmid mobilization relaxosome protein MobC n=1 Tax=Algoriphagus litoralis TaxID=2202829 RepID=UPI000DBAB679|nr:plasmid mobilization relaxosome protein MobC [Algoriphagus litoralis]